MTLLRRLGVVALALAFAQIVFGAIVRITGSGMGCGDHWPKCHGLWFPPLDRADLIIEWTHRAMASALMVVIAALIAVAWRRRALPGVTGAGGVLRPLLLAFGLGVAAAVLGAVTVKLDLEPLVVVAHLVLAMALLTALVAAIVRAGGFGGAGIVPGAGSARAARGATAAMVVALLVLLLGALTANLPGAAPACQGFPLCNGTLAPSGGPAHVHMTHRIVAFLLFFHLLGLAIATSRRGEPAVIVRWARVALVIAVVQIGIAAALVETFLPPTLQSLHQAVGTLLWIAIVVLALVARAAARGAAAPSGAVRGGEDPLSRGVSASAATPAVERRAGTEPAR